LSNNYREHIQPPEKVELRAAQANFNFADKRQRFHRREKKRVVTINGIPALDFSNAGNPSTTVSACAVVSPCRGFPTDFPCVDWQN